MLIKNLKSKAAVALLAGSLTLTAGLAAAGALTGVYGQDPAPTLDRDVPDFPSSTDGDLVLEDEVGTTAKDADESDESEKARADNAKGDGHADEGKGPGVASANHGAEVSEVARDDTPSGVKNHGEAVCTVASRGKCMPPKTAKQAAEGRVEQKSFDDQIERCDAKGDEKAVTFREDHKREQANHTHDKEAACEEKFETRQTDADASAESGAPAKDRRQAGEDHGSGKSAEHRPGADR